MMDSITEMKLLELISRLKNMEFVSVRGLEYVHYYNIDSILVSIIIHYLVSNIFGKPHKIGGGIAVWYMCNKIVF